MGEDLNNGPAPGPAGSIGTVPGRRGGDPVGQTTIRAHGQDAQGSRELTRRDLFTGLRRFINRSQEANKRLLYPYEGHVHTGLLLLLERVRVPGIMGGRFGCSEDVVELEHRLEHGDPSVPSVLKSRVPLLAHDQLRLVPHEGDAVHGLVVLHGRAGRDGQVPEEFLRLDATDLGDLDEVFRGLPAGLDLTDHVQAPFSRSTCLPGTAGREIHGDTVLDDTHLHLPVGRLIGDHLGPQVACSGTNRLADENIPAPIIECRVKNHDRRSGLLPTESTLEQRLAEVMGVDVHGRLDIGQTSRP